MSEYDPAAEDDYLRDHDDRPTRSDLTAMKADRSEPPALPEPGSDAWADRIREGQARMIADRARTAPRPSTHRLKVGDMLIIDIDGTEYLMVIHRKDPAGSAGRAISAGPRLHASIVAGGWSVDFDDTTTNMNWRKP